MASNRGKRKPHQIQQGPQAELIDTMFDELYRRIAGVEDVVIAGGGGVPVHQILSVAHDDTTVDTPVDGDILIRTGGEWARLPKDATNLKVLQLVAGLPAWGVDGSLLEDLNAPASAPLPLDFEAAALEEPRVPLGTVFASSAWIDEPFDAADYSGGGAMTWTVDATAIAYNKWKFLDAEHKTIIWFVYVKWFAGTSTLGGTADTRMRIRLPNALGGPASQVNVIPFATDNSGVSFTAATAFSETTGNTIEIKKFDGTNWTLGTGAGVIFTTILAVD
jgi:hypothetical protein